MGAWENLKSTAGASPPKSPWERLKEAANDRQELSAIKAQQAHEATQTAGPAAGQQEGRYRPVAIDMPRQAEANAVTPVSIPKVVQRSGNYNLQSLPDLGRGPSRAATTEKTIKSGWADERVWDRQISTAIGTLEKLKISTLPFTGEPPALRLLSATAATNQQEGRSRPTAVSTSKQRNKQSSLATERADEADKMMVPSESRQRQQALATERADEADKMLVPSASRQAAQSTTTSSAKSQEGRSRPVEIDMPKQVVTQEEWAAQQWNALTQKINDAQTKLDAANARYASVARYGTVEDRISLRTEIRDLEQQIKDLKKERGDPNLLERIEKTLSGSAKLYGAQFLGVDEWLSNVEQSYQEWKEDAGIPSGGYKDGPGGRVWGEEPTAESARKQAEYVQNLGSNLKESGAADVERAKEGLDGVGRTLVDVGVASSQMLGDVGLGIVTGGGSMLPMLVRSFGGGVQEAREKGYSVTQQTGLGLASAATEYFTERLFDGNPAYDKDGLINKLVERVAGDGKLVSALSSVPAEIISEGLEEVIADILEPISEKVLTGNWTGYDVEQIIHDGIVGMALGGLGQGGQYIAGKARGVIGNTGTVTQKTALNEAADMRLSMAREKFVKTADSSTISGTESSSSQNMRLTEDDLQEYMDTGTRKHFRDEKTRIKEAGISPILTSASEIRHFMQQALHDGLRNTFRAYGKVGSRMSDAVAKATDGAVNINGYFLELGANDVAHLRDHLGEDADPRSIPLTEEQILSIPDYIDTFDDLIEVTRRKDGSLRLMLGKKINGHSIIIETVSKGRHSLHPTTAWQIDSERYNRDYKTRAVDRSSTSRSENRTTVDISRPATALSNITIPQPPNGVKSGESAPVSYADTFREMQPPGARQSKSYADDLAHVNELLQNAELSPRDQAYIQEDIADAQRSCDAAMKVIVNPGTTAEERAQAVRRAIDALDYARQRIDGLGLPATQLGVSTAQDALADIAERLKPFLDDPGGFREL